MTKPNTRAFLDCRAVFERAAQDGRAFYKVKSYQQAVNFRQRSYSWRKEQQRLAKEQLGDVPGIEASTPYDHFALRIIGPEGDVITQKPLDYKTHPSLMERPHVVEFYSYEIQGEILGADGEPITEDDL